MLNSKEEYIAEAKRITKEEFLQLHNHPFLVQYATDSSNSAESKKLIFSTITVTRLEDIMKLQDNKREIKNIFPVLKSSRNPFASKITIGRTSTQDIVIEDTGISKFHAYFEIKEGQYSICDRGSTNGSSLNWTAMEASVPILIRDRDTIAFAGISFNYYTARTAYETFKVS